ncbi:hypothetical protein LAWI1_G002819, partial [Lachnellula willkommii]
KLLPEDWSSSSKGLLGPSLSPLSPRAALETLAMSIIYPTLINPPDQAYRIPSDSSSPAVFPIPLGSNTENSSGTLSSGSKRKRVVVDDSSDAGRSRTRASSTSDFNNNIKAQYNNKCWHYGASPADVCYVISSRDNTRWSDRLPREAKSIERDRTLRISLTISDKIGNVIENWVVARAQFRDGCVLLYKYIRITRDVRELKGLG